MPFDPAALLMHRDFVRAVARSLLDDPHLVDDVEQETWAMALDRPPRKAGSLAAWLGKVARRLAFRALRSRGRRGRRERASSPPRPLTSPDEMAEALETQQRLVAAVLRLDRLYREAILLRFYEGLPPREAAARLGVPVNTVRTRTRRALELLRADLQRDDRRAWFLGLLPLLSPRRAVLGAILMKAKIAAVAALLVLSGVVAWQLAPRAEMPRATAPVALVPEAAPVAAACRLSGRVVDGDGRPVAGARVEISSAEGATDASGAFALEAAREGPDVLAASSGALEARQAVELKHGDVSAGTLVLEECVTVSGIVLGPAGEGASGAVVEAWPRIAASDLLGDDPLLWARTPPPLAGSTIAGEGGAFRLPLPRDAAMVLRARKGDAMSRDEVGYDLREDTGLVVLRLWAPGTVRGRVVDLGGAPVAGAEVHLVPPPRSHRPPQDDVRSVRSLRATSAADGTFALAAPPEAYGALVTHPGYVPFHAARIVAPREAWTIRLSPGQALGGTVEAAGRPAARVRVRVVPTDGHAAPQETVTDDAGGFAFAHAALERPFHLFADGGRLGTALLRDVEWRGEPVRVALDAVSDVKGRVVLDEGTPVPGVRLEAWEFMVATGTTVGIRGYREAVSGPDGRFLLEGASRCLAVWLVPSEPWILFGDNRIRADGSEVVLTVKPSRLLEVRVADAEGAPVAGAMILDRAFTDEKGACRVLVHPWMTELAATKPGLRGVAAIPAEGGAVSIVLNPVPALRGVVRDPAGAPLADVRVQSSDTVRYEGGTRWGYRTTFTDASGAFALDIAGSEAEERVTFERAGFAAAVATVRVGDEVKEIVLEPGHRIEGRVVDEEKRPIAGVAVAEQRVVASSHVTWTAADGRFVLEDVEPVAYLSFWAPGYARLQMVRTEAETERTVVLARELVITGQVLMGDGAPAFPVYVSATAETPVQAAMGAQTDAEGRFRIPGLSAGRYALHVGGSQHIGRKEFEEAEWEPLKGVVAGTTGLVLRQKAPQFLAGIVTDENDRPLRGARVNLYDSSGGFEKGEYVDDNGRFRLPVRSGKYELRVNLAGMAFRRMRGVESGREDLVLRFARGREIAGQLVSRDGRAPASASVEVSSDEFHGYAEVDRAGGFSIRGLPPGTYELTGAARVGDEAMRGAARADAGATGVRIELGKIELR